jgi:anti-sigma factor RsiW
MRDPMSSCDEVREMLWPLDRPRGVLEGEEEARVHLDSCSACRAFFERDASITRALRAHDLEARPPEEFRARVAEAIESERPLVRRLPPARWLRNVPWIAAAAVAGMLFGISRAGPPPGDMYAQDFLSRAIDANAVLTPDDDVVSAFFMRELGVPVAPVTVASAPMIRATICLIDGARAALVEYEMDGHTLAHYRVPRADGDIAPERPGMSEENGVCVYRWTDERFQHALVSDMPEERLFDVARTGFRAAAP